MNEREATIRALIPISANLDDFLNKYEYIDTSLPDAVPDLLATMNNIQQYVNQMYKAFGVTIPEWKQLVKEVTDGKANNDDGTPGFGQDDSSPKDGEGKPINV